MTPTATLIRLTRIDYVAARRQCAAEVPPDFRGSKAGSSTVQLLSCVSEPGGR